MNEGLGELRCRRHFLVMAQGSRFETTIKIVIEGSLYETGTI